MRYLTILLLLFVHLQASKILSYNVYDRTERVDIMFTFDTPYEGSIRKTHEDGAIIIKLDGASIESPRLKNVASKYLSKLTITPIGEQTQIIAKVAPYVMMHASKTSDAYGLRLRFERAPDASLDDKDVSKGLSEEESSSSLLPTKPDGQFTQSYYVVIAVLLIGVILLLWLKRSVDSGGESMNVGPLLKSIRRGKAEKQEDVKIRFQRALDQKNRVVMMDYGDESYLLLIGTSNVMLDKFHGNSPVDEGEFDSMLKEKDRELDEFLQIDKEKREPLDSYKHKASGRDYDA